VELAQETQASKGEVVSPVRLLVWRTGILGGEEQVR